MLVRFHVLRVKSIQEVVLHVSSGVGCKPLWKGPPFVLGVYVQHDSGVEEGELGVPIHPVSWPATKRGLFGQVFTPLHV